MREGRLLADEVGVWAVKTVDMTDRRGLPMAGWRLELRRALLSLSCKYYMRLFKMQ